MESFQASKKSPAFQVMPRHVIFCVSDARHWRAGKIVGMLLEGVPYKTLAMLCDKDSTVELNKLVDLASPMLEIQRLELASMDVTQEEGLLHLNPIVRISLRFFRLEGLANSDDSQTLLTGRGTRCET
jgi:hypothetical protein